MRGSSFSKFPSRNEKYLWTSHSRMKMQYYGISEGRVKRIIRFPIRHEEGIVPDTIAVMQPAGTKRYQEIWVMYRLVGDRQRTTNPSTPFRTGSLKLKANPSASLRTSNKSIKIITAWRYPGKSSERDPIPQEIIAEVRKLL